MSFGATIGCVEDPSSTRLAPLPTMETGQPAVAEGDSGDPDPTAAGGRSRYPADQIHSPLTSFVAERMNGVVSLQENASLNVFMKVGDSITYSSSYLHCFAGTDVNLDDHVELQDTLDHFRAGLAGDSTPFDRWSHAVLGGKTASWVMTGSPTPLEQEIDAIAPSMAVVMFGTNDAGYYAPDTGRMLSWYGSAMMGLTDGLLDEGIVPILMTIPPRTSNTTGPLVGLVNGVVRGLAQGRQIPLVDYYRAMEGAPSWGLSGDGVHPNTAESGACVLTEDGVDHGYNLRNLLTLEVLDRVRGALDSTHTVDEVVSLPVGTGTAVDPIIMDALPFTWMSDTAVAVSDQVDEYEDCGSGQDESGPEEYYSLHLEDDMALRIGVVDSEAVDVDVHLLSADGASCLARADTVIEGTLSSGDYQVVVDTYVDALVEQSGEYLLIAVACDENDNSCEGTIE